MPNFVLNGVVITGPPTDIEKVKSQLSQGFKRAYFHQSGDFDSIQEKSVITFSNPVFAFWNIVNPVTENAWSMKNGLGPADLWDEDDPAWFRKAWGPERDVAVSDGEEFPTTLLNSETETSLSYQFDTAWVDCRQVIRVLAIQYPTVEIVYDFEYPDDGNGGSISYSGEEMKLVNEYLWKCDWCDYQENDEVTQVCPNCEADDDTF